MTTPAQPESLIAQRLRQERQQRGWTLDDLAARSQVSRAMISKIERGQSNPTAALLDRLAAALGLGLSALMSEPRAGRTQVRRQAEQPVWTDPDSGYTRRLVSPPGQTGDAEIVAIELPVGATVRFAPQPGPLPDDQLLLLEGQLRLQLGEQWLDLRPGDCARIATPDGHAFVNLGKVPARYLVVARSAD
jgi:transcriptional regulator with XRE-family HTH domain